MLIVVLVGVVSALCFTGGTIFLVSPAMRPRLGIGLIAIGAFGAVMLTLSWAQFSGMA